jgi:hypothetical protein
VVDDDGREMTGAPALAGLSDTDLALARMDAFDRLELAEYAAEQQPLAAVPADQGDAQAEDLDQALTAWLAIRTEQSRRRGQQDPLT